MNSLSIFGTSSDAGKSTLTFVIGKLLQERGVSVGVFKAQNVSNNSHVCDDGSEIAIAQYFQAEVLSIPTSYHLNPVLLKSGHGNSASLIVKGHVVEDKEVREYYRDLDLLKPAVDECFEYLSERYECVICEGAGSPVELNLMEKDLSNIYIAETYSTKIILVADIERGGVFASIWGVYNLLPEKLRENVIGVIVNKFRGDRSLFDDGVRIIEERFGIPVLGVLPYTPLNLGFEDSQSLKNFVQNKPNPSQKIGIINYPTMSNYNDFEPLIADETIAVEFITTNIALESFDLVILPGSKRVIEDLRWLKQVGLFDTLQMRTKEILGICGGYQMMFETIIDEGCVETSEPSREEALGFIDDVIVFQRDKVLKKGKYEIFGRAINGFEIHHGVSEKYPLSYEKGHIKGTFVHGLFDDEVFERYKKKTIEVFMETMRGEIDVERVIESINAV
ncbi:cobyric acid synthase [Sulfuricurvum sp.]|uniref:cobyric acid synthase n=1 Tax=Sulfuricurvum sp. TaxID=2025608 RepID=UPI002630176C|nr:cobyric acid synthase [Sulfuricurvum sp.]MDD2780391.1 cobyric acid synthase [Sulfuricurvum sp.]